LKTIVFNSLEAQRTCLKTTSKKALKAGPEIALKEVF
jgi:hypothetical protein